MCKADNAIRFGIPRVAMRQNAQLPVCSIWCPLGAGWACGKVSQPIRLSHRCFHRHLLSSQVFRSVSSDCEIGSEIIVQDFLRTFHISLPNIATSNGAVQCDRRSSYNSGYLLEHPDGVGEIDGSWPASYEIVELREDVSA